MHEDRTTAGGCHRGTQTAPASRVLGRLRTLLRREDASSDVETILLLGFVIIPLCLLLPWIYIGANARFFHRVDLTTHLPYP